MPIADLGRSGGSPASCIRGRVGSCGGGSSSAGLRGGLLKGDVSLKALLGVVVPCDP